MDSSDGEDIFITQNTFRVNALENTLEQEDNINDLWSIINNDEINITSYLDDNNNENEQDSDFSDIDNDVLIKASQAAENTVEPEVVFHLVPLF